MNPLGTNSGVNKTRVYTRTPPCQRFMRFLVVNPETLCWEWRGGKHSGGYGSFKMEMMYATPIGGKGNTYG